MKLGIEKLLSDKKSILKGKRIGVLAHAASLDSNGLHTIERIEKEGGGKITVLFGPEHGLSTKAQDMEPVGHEKEPQKDIPVYSLYGQTLDSLKPTKEMLNDIDVLVVDLQDIGTRYYTYVWTTCLCVEACAEFGKEIVVCDRPNPISGDAHEGGEIEEGYESFVGLYSIPVRHGMTIGEIAGYVNKDKKIGANLTVIPMDGWKRKMKWADTKLKWTNPSPNMRSYSAALLYPGMCLIEATNMSEGRGTDTPFEVVGAPFIDTDELFEKFNALGLDGITAAPTAFIPTMQKFKTALCHGVRWVITDEKKFNSYLTGLAFLWLCNKLYKKSGFAWRDEPYEFVTNRPAIDLLTGSHKFREMIDGCKLDDLRELAKTPSKTVSKIRKYFIY